MNKANTSRLRHFLKEKRITYREVGEVLGITKQAAYHRLKNPHTLHYHDHIVKISRSFNIPVEKILELIK